MKPAIHGAPRSSSLGAYIRRLGPIVGLWGMWGSSSGCGGIKTQAPVYQPETNTGTGGGTGGAESTTDIVQQTTEAQVQDCIDECGRSQQQHPEESAYDCRAMCLTGEMK